MEEEIEKEMKKKDSTLIYALIIMVIIFASIIFVPRLIPREIDTLDSLHEKNLAGKLSPDEGYLYKGAYSFVYYQESWYARLSNPQATAEYNVPFHFSPREVEDIQPVGAWNASAFNRFKAFYMTFNPKDEDLGFIAVSTGEAARVLTDVFGKGVIGACTTDEDTACVDRPIVDCDSTDAPVFYFSTEEETNVLFIDNCIIMTGKQEELFKATDRALYTLLGLMS
ncbi:hypothetical protein GOV09_04205 [Candidatus Woesearchaeota archaeon]|nr:hypothetical protein [Candidatus Woesearchaeota archaeon]